MSSRVVRGPVRISAGVAVLAMVLAGCGGGGSVADEKARPAATPSSASPSAEPALALVDDEARADAGKEIVVEPLTNDTMTVVDGTEVPLDTYAPAELTLTVDTQPSHGTVSVDGTSVAYTATAGYGGADQFTYRLVVEGKNARSGTAVVRITVAEPTPTPTPTPTTAPPAKPKPKPKPKPKKATGPYYANCDAVRAAGAAPIHRGEPGYASRLDRDGDGVGCEPYSGGSSSGGSSSGGSSSGGGGGDSTYYANCDAVRAAGAAPIHAGDPGYGSHLDRDGDGVACE